MPVHLDPILVTFERQVVVFDHGKEKFAKGNILGISMLCSMRQKGTVG